MPPTLMRAKFRRFRSACALAPLYAAALPATSFAATDTALLPRDLSPWGMFANADIVVKAVMIGLALASLATWTLRLERLEAAISRRMARGTGVLATVGAIAPFVGLFGTVWGIMNAFIGISEAHTTNLAVVAPGIAEALLATALGLIAAIPAVVIYNHLTRTISAHRALLGDASAMVLLLISREGDRGSFRLARAAE